MVKWKGFVVQAHLEINPLVLIENTQSRHIEHTHIREGTDVVEGANPSEATDTIIVMEVITWSHRCAEIRQGAIIEVNDQPKRSKFLQMI